jgi:hypothetical protein
MPRKIITEEERREKKLRKLGHLMTLYKDSLGLEWTSEGIKDATYEPYKDIHVLIKKACECQHEVYEKLSSIRNDDYEEAAAIAPIKKSTYMQFVRIAALKDAGKLTEKQISKFQNDISSQIFNVNSNQAFLQSFMSGDNLKIVESEDAAGIDFDDTESPEFNDILLHSAQTKQYIDTVLKERFKVFSDLAYFITSGALETKEFRQIVDFELNKNGGYPNPSSPAKLWAIYGRFSDSVRSMIKYHFEQINELNDEFGLEIELNTPHPKHHPWMDAE